MTDIPLAPTAASTATPVAAPKLRSISSPRRLATPITVTALILREMTSTYGRSPGGYLWAILEPVAGIAVMTLIFSVVLRTPGLGTNFAIFYASGYLPYLMYVNVSGKLTSALGYSRSLLGYPRVTIIDALLARLILCVLTQLTTGYIIFTGILLAYDTQTVLKLPELLLAYSMAVSLGIGIGTMNCFLNSLFPIWSNFWNVLTRPLVLISGVIILPEAIPEPYQQYLWYNPLVHVTSAARAAFYPNYDPSISPVYAFSIGLGLTAIGLLFLNRYHRDLLEK